MAMEHQRVTVRRAQTAWGKGWIWVLRDGREASVLYPNAEVAKQAGERAFKRRPTPAEEP